MTLHLRSPALSQGAHIARKYTCDGANVSPPFTWFGAPDGTRSFILVCTDPDAPRPPFHHWAAYDIPGDWTELPEGYGAESLRDGIRQAINDFGRPGYAGPCPPRGPRPHHYVFRLSALREPTLPLAPTATCAEAYEVARAYILAEAQWVGTYAR